MPRLMTMTGQSLPANLSFVAGSPYPFKVSGLGPDKHHVRVKSSLAEVSVKVLGANDAKAEQQLSITCSDAVTQALTGTLSAWLSDGSKPDAGTPGASFTLLPVTALPAEGSEAGIVTRMLIVEGITPGQPGYNADNVKLTMQYMKGVFLNRIAMGSQFFNAPAGIKMLGDMIKAPNQVKGFELYPTLAKGQKDLLEAVLAIADSSSDTRAETYRQYVKNAIDVAKNEVAIADPSLRGLYGWRTATKGAPGDNDEFFHAYGGQEFYAVPKHPRRILC